MALVQQKECRKMSEKLKTEDNKENKD